MAKGIIAAIQDDDPSCDPIAAALAETGISRDEYAAAYDRVVYDGNFGPVSTAGWREIDGREPADIDAAKELLGRVSDAIDDYRGSDFVVDASEIRREAFREVVRIWGGLPW